MELEMVFVTAVLSGLFALFFIKLSLNVIRLRKMNQITLIEGGIDALDRAIRVRASFSEYVPLGLVMMGTLELNGAPSLLIALLGMVLLLGRYLHARGLSHSLQSSQSRINGTKSTFLALALLALSNIGWTAYQLLESARFASNAFVQ
jgi:uncharacterized membrane protein YecN with MAPEG domain